MNLRMPYVRENTKKKPQTPLLSHKKDFPRFAQALEINPLKVRGKIGCFNHPLGCAQGHRCRSEVGCLRRGRARGGISQPFFVKALNLGKKKKKQQGEIYFQRGEINHREQQSAGLVAKALTASEVRAAELPTPGPAPKITAQDNAGL